MSELNTGTLTSEAEKAKFKEKYKHFRYFKTERQSKNYRLLHFIQMEIDFF